MAEHETPLSRPAGDDQATPRSAEHAAAGNRHERRRVDRNARRPAGKAAAAPTLSRAELWAARGRHNLALQQMAAASVELELPSGLTVQARRLPISALYELGQIPNALLPIVSEWFDAFQAFPDDPIARDDALTEYANDGAREADTRKILRFIWLQCVVDPVFVESERDGRPVLVLRDEPDLPVIHETDLIFLFEWAQGVTESARDWFQSRSAPDLSPAQAGETGGDGSGDLPLSGGPGLVAGGAVE